jgi:hypothetical protein
MGRFVHRFQDQTRPLATGDGRAQALKFIGRLLIATLLLAFLTAVGWTLYTGDSGSLMRLLG